MTLRRLSKMLCALFASVVIATLAAGDSAHAQCASDNPGESCSDKYSLSGGFSALDANSGGTVNGAVDGTVGISGARLPTVGPLFYTDYKRIEETAHGLLKQNVDFRESISPYRENNDFDELVRQFDANRGFAAEYVDPALGIISLQERIERATEDLLYARDLYAFLLVYADTDRMRGDPDFLIGEDACSPDRVEDPNPPDPEYAGRVLEPIVDWCNFDARLRQSVREAAYIRLIFAQQFMVDALGLHFSGSTLLGGEEFVREEVAKLRAAVHQLDMAEESLVDALNHPLGRNCYVSDFYTQAEWALLSQTAERKENAQHHIGTRLSYLDIRSLADVAAAHEAAQDAYRVAMTEGYIKTADMAARTVASPRTEQCAHGSVPDSDLIAEMTVGMLETRAKARELQEGRNIFGFDTSFTPSRPYRTGAGSNDRGLWEQARDAAELALTLQTQNEWVERSYDLNQQDLADAITQINQTVEYDIQASTGCDLQTFDTSDAYYACVATMIEATALCDPMSSDFDFCMNQTIDGEEPAADCSNCAIRVGTMRQTRQDLRTAWLGVTSADERRANILKRVEIERQRNIDVNRSTTNVASETAAFEALIAAANCCTFEAGSGGVSHAVSLGAAVEAGLRPAQIIQQATSDAEIEGLNSAALINNLQLDLVEAMREIDIAIQQFNSKQTEYNSVVGQVHHDVFESKRQHAYAVSLPANDPSYRLVRDSRRLELADQLDLSARLAYLAARRAEFEYAGRLSASNFRISDIYKARTANDMLLFLQGLELTIANLPGSVQDAERNQADLTISVTQHLLGLTDSYLEGQGFTDEEIEIERTRRFQEWVAENSALDENGEPVLSYAFGLSAEEGGVLNNVVRQQYGRFWLHKVAGIDQPIAGAQGVGLNLVTDQEDELGYRNARVSQTGQVTMNSLAGCVFTYRLIPPAVLLGLDYPDSQPSDTVTGALQADINEAHASNVPGFATGAFLGRPLSSNGWEMVIYAGSPDGILPTMDLVLLTDIELQISTTFATRSSDAQPMQSQCVRTDF